MTKIMGSIKKWLGTAVASGVPASVKLRKIIFGLMKDSAVENIIQRPVSRVQADEIVRINSLPSPSLLFTSTLP